MGTWEDVTMEMVRIDISNIKDLNKRQVCCTYIPTFPLNHDVVCAMIQTWAWKDLAKIISLETYEKKDYENICRYKDVDAKTFDGFHDQSFRRLDCPNVFVEGESQSCDCRIRFAFLESENKIELQCPNDYIVNRFLLGGSQKERSLHAFMHLMDAMEIEAYVFLTKEKERKYVIKFR